MEHRRLVVDGEHIEESRYASAGASVRGYNHLLRNLPCEDASCVADDSAGMWHIAIVSDGHGDPRCARSDRGSQIAVETARDKLAEFANQIDVKDVEGHSLYENLKRPSHCVVAIRFLSDVILASWWDRVLDDFAQNPLTEDEVEAVGEELAHLYRSGEQVDQLYGATLICALMVRDLLILLQQGDGICAVLQADGALVSPIGEDDRCYANVTTSLCDDDAADGIRQMVVNLTENPLYACVLATDGVGNSFADDDSLKSYFKELLVTFANDEDVCQFQGRLASALEELTKTGAGDDTSMAVIVDIPAVKRASAQFEAEIQEQQVEARENELHGKLVSMDRKHGLLREQYDDAVAQLAELDRIIEAFEKQIKNKRSEVIQVEYEISKTKDFCSELVTEMKGVEIFLLFPHGKKGKEELEHRLESMKASWLDADTALDKACERKAELEDIVDNLREKYQEAQQIRTQIYEERVRDYEDYHAQYEAIETELEELEGLTSAIPDEKEEQAHD